jgi:hypothetical protein
MNKRMKLPYPKVFLCHSHADRAAVRVLYKRLKGDHVEPWLDGESLLPGQHWEREIREAILKSDAILICLSNAFNGKRGFRHEELKLALGKAGTLPEGDVFIIPLRLEKCDMPASLRHLHRVDLFEMGGYKKLIGSLYRNAAYRQGWCG